MNGTHLHILGVIALQPGHVRDRQLSREVGVLPIRLARAAPSRVPHDIYVGAEAVQHPANEECDYDLSTLSQPQNI